MRSLVKVFPLLLECPFELLKALGGLAAFFFKKGMLFGEFLDILLDFLLSFIEEEDSFFTLVLFCFQAGMAGF